MAQYSINKEKLLQITEGGLLYFQKLFPELKNMTAQRNRFKNIKNHYRDESKASVSIYCRDGIWYMNDFGDPDYCGDMFSIFPVIHNIKNKRGEFFNNMCGIYKEVTGEEPPLRQKKASKLEEVTLPEGIEFEYKEISFNQLQKEEKEFLEKYGIKPEVMEHNQSLFLESYTFEASTGKTYKYKKQDGGLIIGHKVDNSIKIYKPYEKEYKFQWLGEKPEGYVYGLKDLIQTFKDFKYNGPENASCKFICCAGEKDALTLQSLGLKAFCLNSETSTYFPTSLRDIIYDMHQLLRSNFELVILLDKDETGKKCANKILEKQENFDHNTRIVELPDSLVEKGGKDVSDFISLGFPKEQLTELIGEQPVSSESSISPKEDNLETKEKEKGTTTINENKNIGEFQVAYDTLPTFLRECLLPFKGEIKPMMLLSFLTAVGSIMHKVMGRFREDYIFTNLFTIIIAPPASGKSQIKWARNLILPIDNYLIETSKQAISQYQEEMELVKNGEMDASELGPKPSYEIKLIPSDITSAALITQMSDNNGHGLMYDTEIDGLIQSNSGNLRSFSDTLRKSYEGEPLSSMRKKDREHIRVEKGKLSLLLSGTPQQFYKLIPDGENGLYSRVIPFRFNGLDKWLSVYNDEEFDFPGHFEELGEKMLDYFLSLDSLPEPIKFMLSDAQKIKIDEVFERRTEFIKSIAGLDGRATVNRLGAITFKIAMILATLRRLESDTIHNSFQCNSEDFDSAIAISELILNNSINVLRQMNDERAENIFRGIKLDYYYALPSQFTFSESQQIAETMNIKPKTAEKWVYLFRDKAFLVNPTKGHFKKVG